MNPHRRSHARPVALALALLAAAPAAPALADGGECGAAGASRLLASMPVSQPAFPPTGPTYPEGTAVLDHRVILSGPATFGTAGNGSPSQLTVFDRHSGALLAQVPIVGENLAFEHAQSELFAFRNFVYSPNTQLGLLRWQLPGDAAPIQESVSTPFCSVTGGFPCHLESDRCPGDVRPGLPPLPNGVTVDEDGTSYVTDSLQGIVWKIAPAGNGPTVPEVLFCSRALQGAGNEGLTLFGANGIAVDGGSVYVSVTFGPFAATGPTSVVYRLDKQSPGTLTAIYTYQPVEVAPGIFAPPIADGLRFNPKNGHLFVVLGGQNQISELELGCGQATEVRRLSRGGADHPFLNPSTIAFSPNGDTAYVSNHAITCCLPGDPNPGCTCTSAQDLFGVIELCL